MTTYTGRTVGKFCKLQIESSSGAMATIPVNSFGQIGLTYDEIDVTALQEAIKSMLNGQCSFSTTISGPFDNRAIVTAETSGLAPALSGSHTVLSALNGGTVAKSFGFYVGVQQYWLTGDPVFGGIDSVLVSQYTTDGQTYSARISVAGNRANDPAWQTSSILASST
jgi:hypothetical protein